MTATLHLADRVDPFSGVMGASRGRPDSRYLIAADRLDHARDLLADQRNWEATETLCQLVARDPALLDKYLTSGESPPLPPIPLVDHLTTRFIDHATGDDRQQQRLARKVPVPPTWNHVQHTLGVWKGWQRKLACLHQQMLARRRYIEKALTSTAVMPRAKADMAERVHKVAIAVRQDACAAMFANDFLADPLGAPVPHLLASAYRRQPIDRKLALDIGRLAHHLADAADLIDAEVIEELIADPVSQLLRGELDLPEFTRRRRHHPDDDSMDRVT